MMEGTAAVTAALQGGSMRRIVMFNRVSADGYFAGPDGNLNWVVPDPELDRSAAAAIEGVSDSIGPV